VHLAITNLTACGLNIYGGTYTVDENPGGQYYQNNNYVHHTTDPSAVSCPGCKITTTFKSRKQEFEEEIENDYDDEEEE
jgi:hypothetical protein